MRYLSLFSGIEAATAAWHRLGWTCVGVAEIEKFPCRVLATKYPGVPNLGDITKITEVDIAMLGDIDVIVFGSPCQDLSVAGKRKGLDGARSGLFHDAMRIIGWARKHCGLRFALWENVPGAFTSNKGADFAVVVGAMAGDTVAVPPKGWGNEGALAGEEAMVEWSTLDAQWFGVAQRRRRVFALADFGDWTGRPPILLEPESLRGDSAPRRGEGEDTTHPVAPCLTSSGRGVERCGDTRGQDPVVASLVQGVAPTLDQRSGRSGSNTFALSGGLVPVASTGDISHCLNAGGMGRIDYETETMVVCATGSVAHTLKADGFDASEDGTGRGTPIITAYMPSRTLCADGGVDERFSERDVCDALHTSSGSGNKAPLVVGPQDEWSPEERLRDINLLRVARGDAPLIAFNHNAQAQEMRFDPHVSASLTCSQGSAVAFQSSQSGVRISGVHATLDSNNGPRRHNGVLSGLQVRRLTPLECERLQAFPDQYTAIHKAADGPRYKALGNSMCVNVMHWIGFKIQLVEDFWS